MACPVWPVDSTSRRWVQHLGKVTVQEKNSLTHSKALRPFARLYRYSIKTCLFCVHLLWLWLPDLSGEHTANTQHHGPGSRLVSLTHFVDDRPTVHNSTCKGTHASDKNNTLQQNYIHFHTNTSTHDTVQQTLFPYHSGTSSDATANQELGIWNK